MNHTLFPTWEAAENAVEQLRAENARLVEALRNAKFCFECGQTEKGRQRESEKIAALLRELGE